MTEQLRVGFVGLGSQGAPVARRIIDAGFPTTLWARRAESTAPFADTAAAVAPSLRALGAASDLLGVCVLADGDVEEVLLGPDGALSTMEAGGVVMIHSTVHPETCRRVQQEHPDLAVVDAPVSGGSQVAAAGQLLVMAGGDADALARCRPVLAAFGDPVVHLGPLGSGQMAKLLNNALLTAQLGVAADVFDQGASQGLDRAALAEVIRHGSGRSYAADVIAGSDIAVMGERAGPLLAKDVRILADLLPAGSRLLVAAEETLAAMGVDRAGGAENA